MYVFATRGHVFRTIRKARLDDAVKEDVAIWDTDEYKNKAFNFVFLQCSWKRIIM